MRALAFAFLVACSSDNGNMFGNDSGKEDGGGDPLGDAAFNSDSGGSMFVPGPNCAAAGMHTLCEDFDGNALNGWQVAADAVQDTMTFSSAPKSLRAGPMGGYLTRVLMNGATKATLAFDLYIDQAAMNDVVLPASIENVGGKIGVGVVFWSGNLADVTLQIYDGASWKGGSVAKVPMKTWQNVLLAVDWTNKTAQLTVTGAPGQLKFAFGGQNAYTLRVGAIGFTMAAPATTVHIDNLRLDAQ